MEFQEVRNKWSLLKYPPEVLSFNFKAYITSSYDFKDASNLLGNWRENDGHQQSRSEGRTERDWLGEGKCYVL